MGLLFSTHGCYAPSGRVHYLEVHVFVSKKLPSVAAIYTCLTLYCFLHIEWKACAIAGYVCMCVVWLCQRFETEYQGNIIIRVIILCLLQSMLNHKPFTPRKDVRCQMAKLCLEIYEVSQVFTNHLPLFCHCLRADSTGIQLSHNIIQQSEKCGIFVEKTGIVHGYPLEQCRLLSLLQILHNISLTDDFHGSSRPIVPELQTRKASRPWFGLKMCQIHIPAEYQIIPLGISESCLFIYLNLVVKSGLHQGTTQLWHMWGDLLWCLPPNFKQRSWCLHHVLDKLVRWDMKK